MRKIKVSLITTVLNEEESIGNFIDSLNTQIEKPDEVIIVDGGSSDNTVDIIKKSISPVMDVKVIVDSTCSKELSKGPIAKGRNEAIQRTQHDYILVTDAGCILSETWVQEMKKAFIELNCDVVSGWYKPKPGNKFQTYIADIFCPDVFRINVKKFLPSSRSIGFKKSIWKAIGGYPESSYTAEDTVFDLKLFQKTDKFVFNERAVVYWTLPGDLKELKRKLINYGHGEGVQGLFWWKYAFRLLFLIGFPLGLAHLLIMRKKIIVFYIYLYLLIGYARGVIEKFTPRKAREENRAK